MRMTRGQSRALVAPLRGSHQPRVWRFLLGVVVIDQSLSDALELASRMLGVKE